MAYFRAMSSAGGGATATITVTYDSSFYNKTMTCTKGTKTYTKTTTSSGSTTFNVNEEGTWTITCNGVSRQVDVVLEYTTQMAITQTVTVYSAAFDTVSFTDVTGAKTVTTDADGHGSVNISFVPPSTTITFTSSVSKNPSNLSQNYSKNVSITTSTTEVDIMPQPRSKMIYWWGYTNGNIEEMSTANGWTPFTGRTWVNPTFNTRYIAIKSTANNNLCGVGTKNTVATTKMRLIYKGSVLSTSNNYGFWRSAANKSFVQTTELTSSNMTYLTPSVTSGYYSGILETDVGGADLYALWYE